MPLVELIPQQHCNSFHWVHWFISGSMVIPVITELIGSAGYLVSLISFALLLVLLALLVLGYAGFTAPSGVTL